MSDSFFQTSIVTSKQLENAIISKAGDVERIINVFKQQELAGNHGDISASGEQKSNNMKYLEEVSSEVSALQAMASHSSHKTPGFGASSHANASDSSLED